VSTTNDIVQKLWNLCNVLRDDGVTYHQYVTELTYLLFLKMCKEKETEQQLPEGYRWDDLKELDGIKLIESYKKLLIHLGSSESSASSRVKAIYNNAQTFIRNPTNLHKLITSIDNLDWYSAQEEGLGDLYEGLLEKNANESKSGAGQYFTPRTLINVIVELVKPQPGEVISDPAAGTLGFLICANRYMAERTDDYFDLPQEQQDFQKHKAIYGVELVPDTHRLALMNALLHNIEGEIVLGDTLTELGKGLPKSDVILANPPFGTKKGGEKPQRDDFTFVTSNKQLVFLMHIYRNLKKGGRAAVVLPDNVLFEDKTGQKIRTDLMEKCNLHTILRLPTGIFYAHGVKTNVLFFQRGQTDQGNTKNVWIYDLRTNMPSFGKRTPFTEAHLEPFVKVFGDDPNGGSNRVDEGEEGRFRCFTREEIEARGDNLDIAWLRDDSVERVEDLPEPDEIAAEIMMHLQNATEEMQALMELLSGGTSEEGV
jgi:type I restriction enzyme M protein